MTGNLAGGPIKVPLKLRRWNWPELPIYNGFTHDERVRGWQLIHLMVDSGSMGKPKTCSISGSTENLQYHCEDYYSPWNAHTLSQPLHLMLHRRFRQPDPWNRIRNRYATTGAEWFSSLAMQPTDLAATLRAKHGADIAAVFQRAPFCSDSVSSLERAKTFRE